MFTESSALRILLTGARAPVALDLARKFHACGARVYAADSLPHPLCEYSRAVRACFTLPSCRFSPQAYVRALCEQIRKHQIDVLLPTCEETFYISAAREQLAAARPGARIFVDRLDTLRLLHDKWSFISYLRSKGRLVPRTRRIANAAALRDACSAPGQVKQWVFKPVYSRFAADVVFWRPGDPLPRLDVSEARPWLMQQWIDGKQYCAYAICCQGEIALDAVYSADFTAGQGACICFAPLRHANIAAWMRTLVKELRFTGQIAFDFIETKQGALYPLECNPRATSGAHLLEAKALHAFFSGLPVRKPHATSHPKMAAAAMLLYGLRQCRRPRHLRRWLSIFLRSQDVVFSATDPLPFVSQICLMQSLRALARRQGISLLTAATYDIEWNGEEL